MTTGIGAAGASRSPTPATLGVTGTQGGIAVALAGVADPAAASMAWRLSVIAALSLASVIVAPVWVLLASPLLLGLPHVASDLRWMIGRTPLGRERVRLLAVFASLGAHVVTGQLAIGLAAIPLAALLTPCESTEARARRGQVFVLGVALVLVTALWPSSVARIFAQAHNAVALLVLAVFVGHVRSWSTGLAAVVCGGIAIAIGSFDRAIDLTAATMPGPAGLDLPKIARSLGGEGDLGERYALVFAYGQLVHYAVWLWLLQALDRQRGSTSTGRDELGPAWWLVVGAVVLGTLALLWFATSDVLAARQLYFRFALFHGALELAALGAWYCQSTPVQTDRSHTHQEAGSP